LESCARAVTVASETQVTFILAVFIEFFRVVQCQLTPANEEDGANRLLDIV